MRELDMLDRTLSGVGRLLEIVRTPVPEQTHPDPLSGVEDGRLSETQRLRSAAYMRVNHAGEIAAQGLYLGQALVARDGEVRDHLVEAARAETVHLSWCTRRLQELDSRISYLTPFWGLGSLGIGFLAGLAGDRYSLGFVEETERQVGVHLESHLERLPTGDVRSRAIVERMRQDEKEHREQATEAGAKKLPKGIQISMKLVSRVMTGTAYWL